jgi:hypothetical protein
MVPTPNTPPGLMVTQGSEPAGDVDVAIDVTVAPLVSSCLDGHECVAVIEIPSAVAPGLCW